jgi:beta-glucanase (GH16 family)
MKLHSLSALILGFPTLLAEKSPKLPPIWSDEFCGTELDEDTWSYDLGNADGWGNAELQNYVESAVTVGDEKLKITVEQKKDGSYTSGRINTKGKFMFKYGTLKAKISVSDLDAGLWPAFWTLGSNIDAVGFPAAGEIDM